MTTRTDVVDKYLIEVGHNLCDLIEQMKSPPWNTKVHIEHVPHRSLDIDVRLEATPGTQAIATYSLSVQLVLTFNTPISSHPASPALMARQPLAEAVAEVCRSFTEPFTWSEVMQRMIARGYKFAVKDPRGAINKLLAKWKGQGKLRLVSAGKGGESNHYETTSEV